MEEIKSPCSCRSIWGRFFFLDFIDCVHTLLLSSQNYVPYFVVLPLQLPASMVSSLYQSRRRLLGYPVHQDPRRMLHLI